MEHDSGLLNRIADRFDLSGEPIPGQALAEILGSSRVLIEGHRGITQYDSSCVCVRVSFGSYRICGRGLELRQMTGERVIIYGQIQSVSVCRRNSQ